MSFALITMRKDSQRMRRNPAELVMWLGVPLIIGTLIILASGGKSGVQPKAHILVVDHDKSILSGLLIGALTQNVGDGLIQGESVTAEAGQKRIHDGDASALLIIPEGFGAAVLREEATALQLITNPAQRILPGIIEESLSILVDVTFYAHRLIGDDLRAFAEGPEADANTFPDVQIADFSIKINRLVDNLQSYLSPMILQLETSSVEEKEKAAAGENAKPQPSFAILFLPSILYMSLLFMSSGLAEDIWQEKESKTLRRIISTPQTIAAFLFGKILWGMVVMLGVSTIALSIGFLYFELSPVVLPLGILWAVFSGSLLMIGMVLLQIHASSKKTANIMAMAVLFPLMMIGGNFFPFEAMPDWMANIGRFTPNGWSMLQLKAILLNEIDVRELIIAFGALLAMWAGLFWLSVRRIRTAFVLG